MKIVFALVGIFSIASIGCRKSHPDLILFIVPDSFRGEIRITKGSGEKRVIVTRDGTVTIHIPEDGIVNVDSLELFTEWHSEEFRTEGGRQLESRDYTVRPNEIAVYDGGMSFSGYAPSSQFVNEHMIVRYFVGTKSEYIAWKAKQQ